MPGRKKQKWQRQRNSHLATDYPHQSKCTLCGRLVLAGNVIGLMTLYDPYILSTLGEAEALLRQLKTYHAHYPNFDRRTPRHIVAHPVPILGHIIREHRCSTPPPLPLALAKPHYVDVPDNCPF